MIPTDPSTRESCSMAVTYSTDPIPAPPSCGGKGTPSSPGSLSSLMVASGNSPASSHLRTLGAIWRCANSRTLFLSCSCSSLSWKSKEFSYLRERLLHHRGRCWEKCVYRPVGKGRAGPMRKALRSLPEDSLRHPQRRHKHVRRIGEKCRLIPFDQMSQPGQRKRRRNQQQCDDPVKPHHNQGRES